MAPSTYYAARSRPRCRRAQRDAELIPRLVELGKDNYEVYGSRKLWKAARRAGIDIGRDQTRRVMAKAGIQGARRTKRVRTTRRDHSAGRHPDLVKRQFTAAEPNRLWVTDLTFVATWAGVAYVCFIVDAFSRMIVGWRVALHMRTPMVLDAIEMRAGRAGSTMTTCAATATPARSSPPSATASGSPRSARSRRSAPSATRSTTRWPKPSTAITGPNSSAARPARARGRPSRTSSSRRSLGALAQQPAPARLPRRPPARRVRAQLLRCPTGRQDPDNKGRSLHQNRTVQSLRAAPWWPGVRRFCPV